MPLTLGGGESVCVCVCVCMCVLCVFVCIMCVCVYSTQSGCIYVTNNVHDAKNAKFNVQWQLSRNYCPPGHIAAQFSWHSIRTRAKVDAVMLGKF